MPNANGQHQRLVAILAADAAGYSRLMAVDASATVDALDAARQVFRAAIESHHGRVIDMAGDSVLAVFETAIGAVSAALEVQPQIEAAAATLPEERRMRFRIGVHLGDVIEKDDGSVYGDGVNIAARLQALAEPGGITVSDAVRGAVRNRLGVRFDDQGEQQVKNIADPVRAFRIHAITVAATPAATAARSAGGDAIKAGAARWLAVRWWMAGILALGLAAAGTWALLARPWAGNAPQSSPYSLSVAVMPFVAGEARPADAALADALAQSLTTNLGQVRTFKVAAPGHSTNEPGKAFDARRIGRELNVRYIVLGETRPQGDKLGVILRLVEAENAPQLWSERFELAAAPTGEQQSHLQGRLARNVVDAVYGAAQDRAVKQPELVTPIDFVLRGQVATLGDTWDTRQARIYVDKALQLDPDFVPAILGQAWVLLHELRRDASMEKERIAEMAALTARAVALDESDALAWRARVAPLSWLGRWGEAVAANEKARALLPWSPGLVADHANLVSFTGRQSEAEALALRAIEMEPPGSTEEFRYLCQARLLMGRYAAAVPDCERASALDSSPGVQMLLAAVYAQTGDTAKAAIVRAGVLKKLPKLTIANSNRRVDETLVPAYRQQFDEQLLPGLLKAGFAEK